MENKCSLSEFIKRLRKDSNMTQEQFAGKIKVSTITLIRWENGKITNPRRESLKPLEEKFNIRIDDFVDMEKVEKDNTQGQKANTKSRFNKTKGKPVLEETDLTKKTLFKILNVFPTDT